MTTTSHAERRRQFWLEHFDACTAGGGSIKAYAREHGLSVASFYTARKRYACTVPRAKATPTTTSAAVAVDQGPRFVRVHPSLMPQTGRVGCRARLANGVVVKLDLDVGDLEGALRAFAGVS